MTFSQLIQSGLWSLFTAENVGENGMMFALMGFVVLSCVCGYFCGCFNTAIFVSKKFYGSDIRESGSKNAGMTNMFRVFGKKAGLLTLAGDALKTVVAVCFGYLFIGYSGAWLSGLFCVLGHMFPFCYKFKGGKGVLVSAVVLLLTDWPVFLACIAVFAIVLLGTKIVSLASIMSAFMMPLFLDILYKVIYGDGAAAGIRAPIAVGIMLAVVFGHWQNIKRMKEGKEPKITFPWDKKGK